MAKKSKLDAAQMIDAIFEALAHGDIYLTVYTLAPLEAADVAEGTKAAFVVAVKEAKQ